MRKNDVATSLLSSVVSVEVFLDISENVGFTRIMNLVLLGEFGMFELSIVANTIFQ